MEMPLSGLVSIDLEGTIICSHKLCDDNWCKIDEELFLFCNNLEQHRQFLDLDYLDVSINTTEEISNPNFWRVMNKMFELIKHYPNLNMTRIFHRDGSGNLTEDNGYRYFFTDEYNDSQSMLTHKVINTAKMITEHGYDYVVTIDDNATIYETEVLQQANPNILPIFIKPGDSSVSEHISMKKIPVEGIIGVNIGLMQVLDEMGKFKDELHRKKYSYSRLPYAS